MTDNIWIDLATAACNHAGIEHSTIDIVATWDQKYCANAVYRLDNRQYLKIFGPTSGRQFYVERSVLKILATSPSIPAPQLVVEGQRNGEPPYLIFTAIEGSTAENIWDDLPRSEQMTIAREIGVITAAIHRLPTEDLAAIEEQVGGKNDHIQMIQPHLIAKIESIDAFSPDQCETLIDFVHGEAVELLNGPSTFTHFDLAHNHIYLNRKAGIVKVSGFIDWAEAMLGPPEWDIAYLWFWTFSGDREAMRECLGEIYADSRQPERFARRCLAAIFYTSSIGLLLPRLAEHGLRTNAIVQETTALFFPEDVFGSPD